MLVEIRQSGSDLVLDRFEIDEPPHPGRWFLHRDTSYLVMQRRHRYRLQSGSYQLSSVILMVKPQVQPKDAQLFRHGWVIGDPNCRFNARSPLIRCAVLPEGPCERCTHWSSVHP